MIFERIKSEGIAHNSYFVGSGSEAAVIDPRRDIDVYTHLAQRHGIRITRVFETHRNEDYVIGSAELAQVTSVEVYHGQGLKWNYGITLKDNQEFRFGHLQIKALATPGHTDESVSYVLTDLSSGNAPVMVFTGDALFVDDTGRTDLYGPGEAPRLAGNLYETIFHRLLPLGDGVILCPAHGAGSVCGMHIGSRDESTLGIERIQNPVLQWQTRDIFIKHKLAERPERPYYFSQMEKYNLEGPPLLGNLPVPVSLKPAQFLKEMENGAIVVDTSMPAGFGGAHVKGAYNIWLGGVSAFAGWVLPYNRPILLVVEDQSYVEIAVRYLVRIGYDNIRGFLKGGTEGWYDAGYPIESTPLLSVQELRNKLDRGERLLVLDVRDDEEWASGHIAGAVHLYVGHLEKQIAEVPRDKPVAVVCSVGHRAGLGASILLRAGFPQVYNVLGGVTAWRAAGFPLVTD